MQEKPLSKISVQDVLNRAHVSRSAFYAHYSDKVDLLLTDLDEFLESVATHLSRAADPSERIAVVTEFFAHVAEAEHIRKALARSGRLGDFYDLARQHFARGIERRLKELRRSHRLGPQSAPPWHTQWRARSSPSWTGGCRNADPFRPKKWTVAFTNSSGPAFLQGSRQHPWRALGSDKGPMNLHLLIRVNATTVLSSD
jgi:AcrR family transcriptional regulator